MGVYGVIVFNLDVDVGLAGDSGGVEVFPMTVDIVVALVSLSEAFVDSVCVLLSQLEGETEGVLDCTLPSVSRQGLATRAWAIDLPSGLKRMASSTFSVPCVVETVGSHDFEEEKQRKRRRE